MGGGAGVHHPWRGALQLHLLQRRNETRLVPCLLLVLLLLGWGRVLQRRESSVGLLRRRPQQALTALGASTTSEGPARTSWSAPWRETEPRAGGSRPAELLLLLGGAATAIAALLPAPALLLLLLLWVLLLQLLLRWRCSGRG